MTAAKFLLGLMVLLAMGAASAQTLTQKDVPDQGTPGTASKWPIPKPLMTPLGIPPPAPDDSVTYWSVYTCPDDVICKVPVKVEVISGACKFTVYDIVDRNKDRPHQFIFWKFDADPTGFELSFRDEGIKMIVGVGDVDSPAATNPRERLRQILRQNTFFLTYDILAQYKNLATNTTTPCAPHGPAIINRG